MSFKSLQQSTLSVLAIFAVLAVVPVSSAAGDWPLFRGDPALQGVAVESNIPERPRLIWEIETDEGMASTPVIVGEHVYLALVSGDLLCVKLSDGKEVWKYQTLAEVKPNQLAPAFMAPIAATDKLVFAGDQEGTLHAVDRATGKRVWTYEDGGEFVGGPNLYKDRVIFGTHKGKLTCLDQATGQVVHWKYDTEGPINGTPTIAGQFTFATNCQAPFLKVVDIETGNEVEQIPIEGRLIASAAFRDGMLYFGTEIGAVYALNDKGVLAWTYSNPDRDQQIDSSPAVTNELVVIGHGDKQLHAIDRKTGQARWTVPTRGKIDCSPVIAGDKAIFGSNDKQLYLVRLSDGEVLWKHNAAQPIRGSAAVAGDRFVIGADNRGGKVMCFGK